MIPYNSNVIDVEKEYNEVAGFRAWLASRAGEDSPVGDLARDVARDEDFPRNGSDADVFARVGHYGCREAVMAARVAWREYMGGGQYATEDSTCDVCAHIGGFRDALDEEEDGEFAPTGEADFGGIAPTRYRWSESAWYGCIAEFDTTWSGVPAHAQVALVDVADGDAFVPTVRLFIEHESSDWRRTALDLPVKRCPKCARDLLREPMAAPLWNDAAVYDARHDVE